MSAPFALSAAAARARLPELAALLHAVVSDGASVNFILPFPLAAAEAFWTTKVFPAMEEGTRTLLVVETAGTIVASVQLSVDTPPNQPHRAEVMKLLTHPAHRRRGHARALMAELERRALALGRTLLTLDTRTGDGAEPLYASLGYVTAGRIPDFCIDTVVPRFDPTTLMWKALGPHRDPRAGAAPDPGGRAAIGPGG
jgi:ribosomal protein S18 acetylase RimI-like enzyme